MKVDQSHETCLEPEVKVVGISHENRLQQSGQTCLDTMVKFTGTDNETDLPCMTGLDIMVKIVIMSLSNERCKELKYCPR